MNYSCTFFIVSLSVLKASSKLPALITSETLHCSYSSLVVSLCCTVSTKEFTGSVVLTEAQREYLEDWYDNVLGSGVLRFVMKDPQTLQPAEFRFLEEYDEEASDGLWIITMKLEKMNA